MLYAVAAVHGVEALAMMTVSDIVGDPARSPSASATPSSAAASTP